jgi:mono/diheme cytochrome c family protein
MLSRLSVFAVLLAFAATTFAETPFDPAQLQKFSREYCAKCHNAEKQKGDFNFEPHVAKANIAAERKVWEKVAELLENREMPPEDKPQPTEAQRTALIQWIDRQLSAGDTEAKNPGRVTLRRLNNEEYRNTIRDLLAVDYNPDDFPQDETAYGFDTIADALTLPPLLMEKYLHAADQIVTRALANDQQGPPSKRIPGVTFRASNGEVARPQDDVAMGFFREGDATAEIQFAGDGEYTLRFRLYGDQAGPDLPRLAITLDGQPLATFDVKERGKPGVYEIKVPIQGAAHKLTAAYLNNYNETAHPDPKMRGDRNVYLTGVDVIGPMHVKQQPPESFRRIFTHMPSTPEEEAKVTRELLSAFATRAYRRAVSPEEVERLAKLSDAARADKAPFIEAIGVGIQAALCSPHFLFRWELDPAALKPGDVRNLNDFEIASRVSYFLWSSMPDKELFDLAERGELTKQLPQQVARMLKDGRAQAFTRNFSSQWLQIRALNEIEIDRTKFPKFNNQLREAMKEESRLFFDAIVREDRSVFELIKSDFTFVNQRLADHYGLPGVQGDKFQRVALPGDSPRGGVLGQGSVLLATSMPTRTSPVVRGKWVLEQILGTPPPPAPANVPPLEETKVDKNAPLRVRLEQHRQNPDCAGCHAKIDPVGFALENFDAIGAWRTEENGQPIDTSSVLPGGKKLSGFNELRDYLKGDKFVRGLAEKLLIYAVGRGLERYDKAALEQVVAGTKLGDDKMSALIIAVVTSDPFLKRKREVAAR